MYDWTIHYVADEVMCEECGEFTEDVFRPGMADIHTHGLTKYESPELQIVLALPVEQAGWILNAVGEKIQKGLVLYNGMLLDWICDGVMLKAFRTADCEGNAVFRIIIPDEKFRFPEDSTQHPYCDQYEDPYVHEITIDNIIVDLASQSGGSSCRALAYAGDSVVASECCDDIEDFKDFFDTHSDRITANTDLSFKIRAADRKILADAIDDIDAAFRTLLKSRS